MPGRARWISRTWKSRSKLGSATQYGWSEHLSQVIDGRADLGKCSLRKRGRGEPADCRRWFVASELVQRGGENRKRLRQYREAARVVMGARPAAALPPTRLTPQLGEANARVAGRTRATSVLACVEAVFRAEGSNAALELFIDVVQTVRV